MSESLKDRIDFEASGLVEDAVSEVLVVTQKKDQGAKVVLSVADQKYNLDLCEVSRSKGDLVLSPEPKLEIEAVVPTGGFKLALAAITRQADDFELSIEGQLFRCGSLRVFREREVTRWLVHLADVFSKT